jgi:hypothetical protein
MEMLFLMGPLFFRSVVLQKTHSIHADFLKITIILSRSHLFIQVYHLFEVNLLLISINYHHLNTYQDDFINILHISSYSLGYYFVFTKIIHKNICLVRCH